jgi:Kef-type K+ transport system membrane component KefB
MGSQYFEKFALQITAMLVFALIFGQLMRKFKQPAVLGEMIGGIILGPTIVGFLFPDFYTWLFRSGDNISIIRDASIKLGMLFYLFIVGLEINLTELKRMKGKALSIGLTGTLLPLLIGIGLAYLMTAAFWGPVVKPHFFFFALFVGINMANSALPVLSRILIDLGLLKKDIGALMMSSTVVDDVINWTLVAIILANTSPVIPGGEMPLPVSILLNIGFLITVLLLGRWLSPYALRWARRNVAWPNGFIAFTAVIILLAASMAERIGIHAFFGAFLTGIAVRQNNEMAREAHSIITHFILSFFAPIYFVSMGMTTNFVTNFDLRMVLVLLLFATLSKVGAVLLGARVAGMPLNRETWAIGFGLNARGATGIILANVGLANGLIDERIFVAMVTMAIITSLMAGPIMNRLLRDTVAVEKIEPVYKAAV